jgi:hypothetical protein
MTTTLKGFPSSWDPFFQGICARSKLPKFNNLWLDCTQEESGLISKSHKTNDDENQALVDQVRKRKEREEGSPKKPKKPRYKKDASRIRCCNCKKMGHYVAQCPLRHEKGNKKHHAHATNAEEHKSKDEEFVFVSALLGTITQGSDTWLIDSGASKHMIGFINSLSSLTEKSSSLQVELGDDSRHAVKGFGEASLQLD